MSDLEKSRQEQVQTDLTQILHILNRKDIEMPPSARIDIESHCQSIWKTIGDGDVDKIYPDYD